MFPLIWNYSLVRNFFREIKYLCTEKTVDVLRCPTDVTLRANSPVRRRAVHWPEPEFIGRDGSKLESSCTKKNGTEFATGSTKVDCFPAGMTGAGCSFIVNVVGTLQQFFSTFLRRSDARYTPQELKVIRQRSRSQYQAAR